MTTQAMLEKLQQKFGSEINYEHFGEDINILTYRWPEGDTCLHIAAMRGDLEAVQLLVDLGVDIDALGDMSNTALHYAAMFEYNDLYEFLVFKGASENIVNEFGKTAPQTKK